MEVNYRYAESTVKPNTLEFADCTVYLSKNVTELVRASEQGDNTTYWTYQEAVFTPEAFNEYTKLLMAENAIKGANDSDNIVSLIVGQEMSDGNILAIMEAIADLYETIAI